MRYSVVISLFLTYTYCGVNCVDPVRVIVAASAAINTGVSLTGTTVDLLSAEGCAPSIVIDISNHLSVPSTGPAQFVKWGYNALPMQPIILARIREATKFEKACGGASGTNGMISYHVHDRNITGKSIKIIAMWSVPFSYVGQKNWFAIKMVPYGEYVGEKMYKYMTNHLAWKVLGLNKALRQEKYACAAGGSLAVVKNNYVLAASMSEKGRAVLKLDLLKMEEETYDSSFNFRSGRFFDWTAFANRK